MAEPKKRLTSARSGARRSHLKSKKLNLSNCSKCQAAVLPHQVCTNCGYFRGKDILKLEEKAKQKEERRKAREAEEEAK
ncbi:MAG: 50S ribosomal protein L32 [Patescibacteria group bacterium]|nr:50S ribosomal protein L32 [Patescibacteria group bacterium]